MSGQLSLGTCKVCPQSRAQGAQGAVGSRGVLVGFGFGVWRVLVGGVVGLCGFTTGASDVDSGGDGDGDGATART